VFELVPSSLKLVSSDDKMINDLTLYRMNSIVLQKQRLTHDGSSKNIVQIVKDIGGLHATNPTTPYLSLLARVKDFRREYLDNELYVKKSLGKIRYVRTTVYILPKDMIPAAFAATRRVTELASEAYSKFLGINEEQYEETSKKIAETLQGQKGMTVKQIKHKLGTRVNVSPIVNLMCDKGVLIRGAPEKGWKSNLHTYYLFTEYFPDLKLNKIDEMVARKAVVRQYFASFGPATENDATWWTGFSKSQVKELIADLRDEITAIDASDADKPYLILSQDKKLLTSARDEEKHAVNLLPSLDPYLMGFKDRERYIDEEHYNFVFDRSGNATSTILVDGRVAGVWDFAAPFVKTYLFHDVDEEMLKEIHTKAVRVGAFISGEEARVKKCDSMIPLIKRTAGSVMSPLKDN